MSGVTEKNTIFMCHGSGSKQHGCRVCWACARLVYEFGVAFLVVRMCRGWDPWVGVKWPNACKTWKQLWWNSWIARCRKVRMGLRYAGRQWRRRLDRWWILVFPERQTTGTGSGSAWPKWSFATKAFDGAVKQLWGNVSSAENNTDVVINVQLGGVQVYVVLIMLCTGRDWNRIANALRGWSTKAWRFPFQACSPKDDARLMLTVVIANFSTKIVESPGKSTEVRWHLMRWKHAVFFMTQAGPLEWTQNGSMVCLVGQMVRNTVELCCLYQLQHVLTTSPLNVHSDFALTKNFLAYDSSHQLPLHSQATILRRTKNCYGSLALVCVDPACPLLQ